MDRVRTFCTHVGAGADVLALAGGVLAAHAVLDTAHCAGHRIERIYPEVWEAGVASSLSSCTQQMISKNHKMRHCATLFLAHKNRMHGLSGCLLSTQLLCKLRVL